MRWTAKNLLSWSGENLKKARVENPRLDSEILLAHALGCSRERILMDPGRVVDEEQLQNCRSLVERRVRREPVHYIIGAKEFWSLEFRVAPGVLIPRPETELLIECLLSRKKPDEPHILDIGTGSGILAIVSAMELPDSRVTAVDISSSALETARYNALVHRVDERVRFLEGNILDRAFGDGLGTFDFILANPPYIATDDLDMLMADVKDFEPRLALDGGNDGLDFYRRIVPLAWEKLNYGGYLIMEIGDGQDKKVSEIVGQRFDNQEFLRDHSGKSRAVFVRKEGNG